jgi:hypothetical protein
VDLVLGIVYANTLQYTSYGRPTLQEPLDLMTTFYHRDDFEPVVGTSAR